MTENYDTILASLKERLLEKHEKYGTSYLHPHITYHWLLNRRLEGELMELRDALNYNEDKVIEEALDVAICALLIADKKLKEREKA